METNEKLNPMPNIWGLTAPVNSELAVEHRAAFFKEALAGTVIEVWDELYRRSPRGLWVHLDELVYTGGSYSDHRDNNTSTPQALAAFLDSPLTTVLVLKLGTEALLS